MRTVDHPFWADGLAQTIIIIVAAIAVAAMLRHMIPPLRRLGMPDALLAGALCLVLGPAVLDVVFFDAKRLEVLVYHGLALVFIAVSLQSPPVRAPGEGKDPGLSAFAFAIPALAVLQGMIGLGMVLDWNAGVEELHPGVGLMLPLGFNQGPGAALSLGTGWSETAGMQDGGQIGLIMAALGFMWCCFGGVTLVGIARWKGWVEAPPPARPPSVPRDNRLETQDRAAWSP